METLMYVVGLVVELCIVALLVAVPLTTVLYGGLWIDKKTGWFSKFADMMFGMDEPNRK